MLTGLLLVYII